MRRKAEILTALDEIDGIVKRAQADETAKWNDDIRLVSAVSMRSALQWVLGQGIPEFEDDEGDELGASKLLTIPEFVEAMTHRYDEVTPAQLRMVRRMTFAR